MGGPEGVSLRVCVGAESTTFSGYPRVAGAGGQARLVGLRARRGPLPGQRPCLPPELLPAWLPGHFSPCLKSPLSCHSQPQSGALPRCRELEQSWCPFLPPRFPSPLRWYLGPPRGLCLQMGTLWGSLCLLMDVTRVMTAGEWAVHVIALSPHSPLVTGLLWRCPSPGELSHGPQRHRPCTHPLPCQEGRGGRCPFRGAANFTVH